MQATVDPIVACFFVRNLDLMLYVSNLRNKTTFVN